MGNPASRPSSPGNYRWVICGLLFWVTTANYIDRGVFSNLAPELQKQFGWSEQTYWNMNVAFNCAYALSQMFMGRFIDAVGLRWGFALACAFWGLASVSHALVTGVVGFFAVRVLLGLGEGGNFPAAIKTTAEWFPKSERALATGIFNSGSNVGGILVPIALGVLVPWLQGVTLFGHVLGWRGAFLLTGTIDLLWIVAWLSIYRKPSEHPKVGPEELAHINSEPPETSVKVPWLTLLKYRQAWAFVIGKGMTDAFWWFYLFGAPVFFADRFHLTLAQRQKPIAIIYVVASVGSIAGGWLAGFFMKSMGFSHNKSRKLALLIAALGVFPVFFAAFTNNQWVAVALITLAASAHQAWSANIFSLPADMFPRRVVGSVVGVGGMAGAIGGIVLFILVGWIQKDAAAHGQQGNYTPVFLTAAFAYLIALGIVQMLVPKLEKASVDNIA